MYRFVVLFNLLLLSTLAFAQNNAGLNIIGRIPDVNDNNLYRIQIGSYKDIYNAEIAVDKLRRESLNPVYEEYLDFTRVVLNGINARDITSVFDKIERAGFTDVIVRQDTGDIPTIRAPVVTPQAAPIVISEIIPEPTPIIAPNIVLEEPPEIIPEPVPEVIPVSTAALPTVSLVEIGYCTIKAGETKNVSNLAERRNVLHWISSTPSTVTTDSNGNITGRSIGNGYIQINETDYISVVVVPREEYFTVPESQEALLPAESKSGDSSTADIVEYRTEPTFRLAYRFSNPDEGKGASGRNGGIDILGRGPNYEWLWTTYKQGGWLYSLNNVMRKMVNGYQKDENNGVELRIKPDFVYESGVPYLQLKHVLHNPGNTTVTDQRFGATADVMIYRNDSASLLFAPYGAYMTDSQTNPSLELMLMCLEGNNINPVSTLWIGEWNSGAHLSNIYNDRRVSIHNVDSAIAFSYQNITLALGETKEFNIRFTLVRSRE